MDRKSITFVVVVVLCAVGFAYGQGWLTWSHQITEMEGNKVSTEQRIDDEQAKRYDVQVTHETPAPADTATK